MLKILVLCITLLITSATTTAAQDANDTISKIMGYDELKSAITRGDEENVRKILKDNKELVNLPTRDGTMPINIAITFNRKDIARILIEEYGCSALIISSNGRLTTHYAALSGDVEMLDYLLNKKLVPINHADKNGLLPIHMAILGAKAKAVNFLIKNGSPVKIISNKAPQPAELAKSLLTYKDKKETQNMMQMMILQMILSGESPTMKDILYNLEDIVLLLEEAGDNEP